MGYDGCGRAKLRVRCGNCLENDNAGGDVERAGGLIAQQHLRTLRNSAGNGDALLFTAG